tara:strand:- start:19 stop:1929 length:1911 start_codon:yes stop_codon:yes gene_type:complete
MKILYKHLQSYIKSNPNQNDISERLFQLGHENEYKDGIYDIEFTPNRGDCLSLKGILRDLSAFYEIESMKDAYHNELKNLDINFSNKAKVECPSISFLKIEIEKKTKPYKGFLKDYFSELDLKKSNFFTDISNYLSYETGQPTHCYDFLKLGDTFSLEKINEDVYFETLLDKDITLTNENLVFKKDQEIINLAGVMGGKSTSCSEDTTIALVECAYFSPEEILGKAIKYDINSDAAHKFERGVDPIFQETVLRRFISIVKEHAVVKSVEMVSYNYSEFKRVSIPMNVEKIKNILGIEISEIEFEANLKKIGFEIIDEEIIIPSYRSDVRTQNDIAEEIARIIGYNNIKSKKIEIKNKTKIQANEKERKLKSLLIDKGFYEVINSPFVSKSKDSSIRIDNPLDSNKNFLRNNLKSSLIENLLYNEKRQKDSVKLFEISDIYTDTGSIEKKRVLGIIASGRVGNNFKDFSKKITNNYLMDILSNYIQIEKIDFVKIERNNLDTKIKNHISYIEICLEEINLNILDYDTKTPLLDNFIRYSPISEFPSSNRDLSFSISDYKQLKLLEQMVLKYDHELIKEIFVFDFFENQKSGYIKIGFRFVFQSSKKTLIDKDIENVMSKIIQKTIKIDGINIPGLEK